jgi:transcriptional regulator with XRE-family HTH domain
VKKLAIPWIKRVEDFIKYENVVEIINGLYKQDEEPITFGHGLSSFEFNNISKLVKENKKKTPSVGQFLNEMFAKKGIRQQELVRKTNFSKSYVSNVINGHDNPPKYKLIRIALAMELSLSETKELLETVGATFNHTKKDKIIVACIELGIFDLEKVDEALNYIENANETLY